MGIWLFMLLFASPDLIDRARQGDLAAQWQAAKLSREGKLPALSPKLASSWYKAALKRRHPEACLEQARERLDRKQPAEDLLRCAAVAGLPEAQYLLGRLILSTIAAEDEPHRFEGLAWVAIAARSGYQPAERRWQLLLPDLVAEDLERVEQTAKRLP
jgi:TPR repeat protein